MTLEGKKADQDVCSLRSELSTLKEDYADLQDKLGALSVCANPAQNWADLRQAALDLLKTKNGAVLQRLSAFEQQSKSTAAGRDH